MLSTIKSNFLFIISYLSIKIAIVYILISIFPTLFNQSYFNYPDLIDNISCDFRSHNGLYSLFLCALGIKDISLPLAVALATSMNFLKDFTFLYIVYKITSKQVTVLFAFFMLIHPYLAIYHSKLSTDLFASLGICYIIFNIFLRKNSYWLDLIAIPLFCGLRNSTIPMFSIWSAWLTLKNFQNRHFFPSIIYILVGATTVFFFFLPEEQYLTALSASIKEYPFSTSYFKHWIGLENNMLSTALAWFLVLVSHTILLMGFREAVFIDFPQIFLPFGYLQGIQLSIFITLFIVHFVGMIWFFRTYFQQKREILFILFLVFPALLYVAHLRYFLPLVPVALWGFALFIDHILSKAKVRYFEN